MKKYIGTKQIEAEPMTLGEACSKGLVKSEIEKNESYKLGYHTRTEYGYESWSPKKLFEESYREVKEETPICFGDAIDVLKQGGAIRRKGWNDKWVFVIKQIPAHIESDIIPKMQSLPQSAKDLIHGFRLLAMCLPMIGRLFNSLSATCKKCNGCVGCL